MEPRRTLGVFLAGLACGLVFAVAYGLGPQDASAAGSDAGSGRVVLYITDTLAGDNCMLTGGVRDGCCPPGFTPVGRNQTRGRAEAVCLED